MSAAERRPGLPESRLRALQSVGAGFLEGAREGAWVCDADGHRYFDGVSGAGAFNLGRRHPALAEALVRAMHETDQGNFPMISIEKSALAEALAAFAPGALDCAVFSVMRGEPVEFACKVARGFTGRAGLVGVEGAWHGHTGFALSLSECADAACYGPLIPEVQRIPFGDLERAAQVIGRTTAAIIVEPVQAENGCREASPEFLRGLEAICRKCGALLVVDETQTGFGRTGRRFAFEESGIAPDLLVLGEALGGGMFPIAATLLTQRVNTFMNKHPMIHLSTFGGSDIGCRVALRALELYNELRPWRNAAAMGERLKAGIGRLVDAGPVRGVAGKGLLLALDLGTADAAAAFCKAAADQGLLLLPGMVAKHTVLLRPSLLINEAEADAILEALRAAAAAC